MAQLHLEIVSPERTLFNGEVEQVKLPGALGSFAILPHHAPLVSTLLQGEVSYTLQGEVHLLKILSGFVEVSDDRVIVCMEEGEQPYPPTQGNQGK